ncbi:MAG: hypothetical protein HYZ83_08030 [Candidatus Omnitrophica bacterium]|nr:hypothetical protein [Candidatus Omnitrophota bacterium]
MILTHPFIPLLLPAFTGLLLILILIQKINFPSKGLYLTAVSLPLGLAIASAALFWAYALFNPHAKLAAYILAFGLLFIFSFFYFLHEDGKHPRLSFSFAREKIGVLLGTIVFFASLSYFVWQFTNFTLWNTFGGWDAKTNWNLKAAFLFRSPENWQAIFSDILVPQMGNYPLLVPASITWGWNWLNAEALIWPPFVGFIYAAGIGLLILWYFSARNLWITGLLAASFYWMNPFYRFWATSQYADIPLCFFITASIITLMAALRLNSMSIFFLSGLLTGFSAWAKNEGLLFTASTGIIFVIALLLSETKNSMWKIKAFSFFLLGLSIPYAGVLYLKMVLAPPDVYSGHLPSVIEIFKMLGNWEKTSFIAGALALSKAGSVTFGAHQYHWNGLWIIFLAAFVYGLVFERQRLRENGLWILPTVIFLLEAGYIAIFHLSPFDLQFHLSTSMHRLGLHGGILALIFAFEIFQIKDF